MGPGSFANRLAGLLHRLAGLHLLLTSSGAEGRPEFCIHNSDPWVDTAEPYGRGEQGVAQALCKPSSLAGEEVLDKLRGGQLCRSPGVPFSLKVRGFFRSVLVIEVLLEPVWNVLHLRNSGDGNIGEEERHDGVDIHLVKVLRRWFGPVGMVSMAAFLLLQCAQGTADAGANCDVAVVTPLFARSAGLGLMEMGVSIGRMGKVYKIKLHAAAILRLRGRDRGSFPLGSGEEATPGGVRLGVHACQACAVGPRYTTAHLGGGGGPSVQPRISRAQGPRPPRQLPLHGFAPPGEYAHEISIAFWAPRTVLHLHLAHRRRAQRQSSARFGVSA